MNFTEQDSQFRYVYRGGYIPDLAICLNTNGHYDNWLFYRHPDGQLVTLGKIEEISTLRAENANLLRVKEAAIPIVRELRRVGDETGWKDDFETEIKLEKEKSQNNLVLYVELGLLMRIMMIIKSHLK